MEMAEREGLAIQSALAEHSVVSFVKNLPIESPLYPAIKYSKELTQISKTIQKNNQEIKHNEQHEFIQWCMPAHDKERPKQKGFGFIRSKDNKGIVFSACPNDNEHYLKEKGCTAGP